MPGESVDTLLIRAVNSRREHDCGRNLLQRCRRSCDKAVEIRARKRQHQAWIGTELPGSHRERTDEVFAQRFGASCQRVRQEHDWIDAAHLRVHRDRLRTFARDFHQCEAARTRAGKSNGFHISVCDQ